MSGIIFCESPNLKKAKPAKSESPKIFGLVRTCSDFILFEVRRFLNASTSGNYTLLSSRFGLSGFSDFETGVLGG